MAAGDANLYCNVQRCICLDTDFCPQLYANSELASLLCQLTLTGFLNQRAQLTQSLVIGKPPTLPRYRTGAVACSPSGCKGPAYVMCDIFAGYLPCQVSLALLVAPLQCCRTLDAMVYVCFFPSCKLHTSCTCTIQVSLLSSTQSLAQKSTVEAQIG